VYRLGFYIVSLLVFRVERWLGFSADFPENRLVSGETRKANRRHCVGVSSVSRLGLIMPDV
jgi:hypothetical protein